MRVRRVDPTAPRSEIGLHASAHHGARSSPQVDPTAPRSEIGLHASAHHGARSSSQVDPTAPRSDAAALESRYTSYSTVMASAPHPADSGADGGLVASRDASSASMDVTTQLRPRCAFQCHTQIPPSSLPPLNTSAARL